MEGRPTDGELFTRAQRGDQAAYEEIVRRYQEVAFRTAYVVTGSAADAEDAAQEGFVKAYRALATFRSGAEPRPWLQRLGRLAAEIEWPATPDMAARVRERLVAPVIAIRRPWFQSRWAVAAAVLVLALAALVAYTPSREAIANWLKLHTIITRVNQLP